MQLIRSINNNKLSSTQLKILDNSKQSLINHSLFASTKNIFELQQQLNVRKKLLKKYTLNDNNEQIIYNRSRLLNLPLSQTRLPQMSCNILFTSNNNILDSKNLKTETYFQNIKKKSTTHTHRKARAFNDKKDFGQLYLADAINESEARTEEGQLKKTISILNIIISALAILSIIIGLTECDFNIHYSNRIIKNKENKENLTTEQIFDLLKKRNLSFIENCLRSLNCCLCIIAAFIIAYKAKLEFGFINKELLNGPVILERRNIMVFIFFILKTRSIDIITALLCFPPKTNPIYIKKYKQIIYPIYLSFIFHILSYSKLFLVIQMLKGNTLWNRKISNAICRTYKVNPSLQFIIKSHLRSHPFLYLILVYFAYLIFTSCIIRMLEFASINENDSDYQRAQSSLGIFINSFWMIANSSFSSGFGDFYPKSHLGRFLLFIFSIFGIIIVALFVLTIISVFEMSKDEKKSFLKLKKLFNPENTEHKAGNLIREILILRKLNEMNKKNEFSSNVDYLMQLFIILSMLRKDTKNFRDNYKIARSFAVSVDDLLKTMKKKIGDNINFFNNHIEKLVGIDVKLQQILDNQEVSTNNLVDVRNYQNNIANYLVNWNNETLMEKEKKKMDLSINKKKKIHKTTIIDANFFRQRHMTTAGKKMSLPPTSCLINSKTLADRHRSHFRPKISKKKTISILKKKPKIASPKDNIFKKRSKSTRNLVFKNNPSNILERKHVTVQNEDKTVLLFIDDKSNK